MGCVGPVPKEPPWGEGLDRDNGRDCGWAATLLGCVNPDTARRTVTPNVYSATFIVNSVTLKLSKCGNLDTWSYDHMAQ